MREGRAILSCAQHQLGPACLGFSIDGLKFTVTPVTSLVTKVQVQAGAK